MYAYMINYFLLNSIHKENMCVYILKLQKWMILFTQKFRFLRLFSYNKMGWSSIINGNQWTYGIILKFLVKNNIAKIKFSINKMKIRSCLTYQMHSTLKIIKTIFQFVMEELCKIILMRLERPLITNKNKWKL